MVFGFRRLQMSVALTIMLLLAPNITLGEVHVPELRTVRVVADEFLAIEKNGARVKLPVFLSHRLRHINSDVQNALVVIPGSTREGKGVLDYMVKLAKEEGVYRQTVIAVPQFLNKHDLMSSNFYDTDVPYWRGGAWKRGHQSLMDNDLPRPVRVSSYEMLDSLLLRLADQNYFPNLETITIVGHSAGGQFVNRYSVSNIVDYVLTNLFNLRVRYVPANSSSYVYLSGERRIGGQIDQFAIPNYWVRSICPNYNQYGYGNERLNSYFSQTPTMRLVDQFRDREVLYLLGELDSKPAAKYLDRNCEAYLQGAHRLERAQIYLNYLEHYYGSPPEAQQLVVVPDVGHSSANMYGSPMGRRVLFHPNR